MSDLKYKVAAYLSSFLSKDLVEITTSTDDYLAGLEKETKHEDPTIANKAKERLAKVRASNSAPAPPPEPRKGQTFSPINTGFRHREAGRTILGREVRNVTAHNIAAKSERDAKLIDKAAAQGNITKPEGGLNKQQRHDMKRNAAKRQLAQGTLTFKSGRENQGVHTGRIDTAVTAALRAAATTPHKRSLLALQSRPVNNEMEPKFVLANTTDGETATKHVSQQVLGDLKAGKAAKASDQELVDLGKKAAAENKPLNVTEKPVYQEPKKK